MDVIVIGAGPAGLAAAGVLRRLGIEVLVLERGAEVGMSWRSRHDHLSLNTHRRLSHLPGLKIDRRAGALPSRDAFVEHLEEYARRFDLSIEFGAAVDRIDPAVDGTWALDIGGTTRRCRHVVVATGSDLVPNEVTWPGAETFTGRVLHAGGFRNVADHAGEDVLVIGAGNSGFDVMNHLARSDVGRLWLSVRSGPTILPLRLLGQPLHPLAVATHRLPMRLQDVMVGLLSRVVVGNPAPGRLPKPTQGAITRAVRENIALSLDDGTAAAIKAGRVEVVRVVERIEGADVVLVDGTRIRPDTIICATGYRPGLGPLVGHLVELDHLGRPPAFGGEPTPGLPGLWFFGVNSSVLGNMYLRLAESRRLARAIDTALGGGR